MHTQVMCVMSNTITWLSVVMWVCIVSQFLQCAKTESVCVCVHVRACLCTDQESLDGISILSYDDNHRVQQTLTNHAADV